MAHLFRLDFRAEDFRELVNVFCFTDTRIEIDPAQSFRLQAQLLRLSDVLMSLVENYFRTDERLRYRYMQVHAKHLLKRFSYMKRSLKKEHVPLPPLSLFIADLSGMIHADCVALHDRKLSQSLSTLFDQPRPVTQSPA